MCLPCTLNSLLSRRDFLQQASVSAATAAAFAAAAAKPAVASETLAAADDSTPEVVILEQASASRGRVIQYNPQTVFFTYCFSHPPVMHIASGDSVVTHTRDASNDAFTPSDTTVFPKLDLTRVNPQTGPFFVDGAEPGDTLRVHIDRIKIARDWGWGAAIPMFGLLAPEGRTQMVTPPIDDHLFIWRFDFNRQVAMLDVPHSRIGRLEVPLRPFFGTIGVAPPGKECISSLRPGSWGANMDFNEVVQGVTMSFPVVEPGALFMIGDGHAAQGDGEIMGAAIEVPMDLQFTVEVVKGKRINWPRLENRTSIMSIGSARPLVDAVRIASVDMINWLAADFGFDRIEAYQLLGQAARLEVCNVVDPDFSAACALDKKFLRGLIAAVDESQPDDTAP